MPRTILLRAEAPAKPPFAAPCNGCGVCCAVEPCPIGMLISRRRKGRCVALVWSAPQSRYLCGLVMQPHRYLRWRLPGMARLARRWIAAGRGCDASVDAHRADA